MITTVQLYSKRAASLESDGWIILDTTIKSGLKAFAPTWAMVMGYKKGSVSESSYTSQYRKMMLSSYKENRQVWEETLSLAAEKKIALGCYCRPSDFCHRELLLGYFLKIAQKNNQLIHVVPEPGRQMDWLERNGMTFKGIQVRFEEQSEMVLVKSGTIILKANLEDLSKSDNPYHKGIAWAYMLLGWGLLQVEKNSFETPADKEYVAAQEGINLLEQEYDDMPWHEKAYSVLSELQDLASQEADEQSEFLSDVMSAADHNDLEGLL